MRKRTEREREKRDVGSDEENREREREREQTENGIMQSEGKELRQALEHTGNEKENGRKE